MLRGNRPRAGRPGAARGSPACPVTAAVYPAPAMGYLRAVGLERWFLTPEQRGNPHTGLDRRRGDGLSWSTGNEVRPLVHGRTYFAELLAALRETRAGDLVLFTDWRGDPDERLAGP